MKHLLWSILLWTGCAKKPHWEINNGMSTDNASPYYTLGVDNHTITRTQPYSMFWRTIAIGDWMEKDVHYIRYQYLGNTCNQIPGCSVAFGVIFPEYDLKQDVNNAHSSVSGFNTQQGNGIEFLGNKWGVSYCNGRGIQINDIIGVTVDMNTKTLSFDVNGEDCGVRSNELPNKVRFAVSTERHQDSVKFISYEKR